MSGSFLSRRLNPAFLTSALGRLSRNPLMRGGLAIGGGILAGNVLGFVRSAVTAYLLGTHSVADGLSIALGPIDTVNSVLTNTMVFGLVPLLTARQGRERAELFRRVTRLFLWVFCVMAGALILFSPWLIHVLGPGLAPSVYEQTVNMLRLTALSTVAVGVAALYSALLYTERRFTPSAFFQAVINTAVIIGALALWRPLGIYSFALGYTVGGVAQYLIVRAFAQRSWRSLLDAPSEEAGTQIHHTTAELLSKPGSFLLYAGLVSLNTIATRAYATQGGPGMAAAFDYSLRCVNVVIGYLVAPVSNSLLPEIARLRSGEHPVDAFRLVNRTLGIAAVVSVFAYLVGILVREPIIAILFQRGHFTAESTRLVSGVFLGFAPSLIGMTLLEIMSRALFSLDRPWLPVIAAAVPVTVNILVSRFLHSTAPQEIGWGASIGLCLAFLFLFGMVTFRRKKWLDELHPTT